MNQKSNFGFKLVILSQVSFARWPEISLFYARRTGSPALPSAHSCIILYYIYYNAPRKTKSKDVLQFFFLCSSHKPKSKDFSQLILLIFYFEYPFETWRNPFLATNFLLCTSSSRSYFTFWRSSNCLPVHITLRRQK